MTVLAEPELHEIADGVWLLPAPLLHRHTLDDPTEAFSMEPPGARLRIGLAHGSIRDFSTQGDAKNLIAPDRAARAKLDYLALGDWHGMLWVDARTWYSGTAEADDFHKGRDEPGHALLVDLAPGKDPAVTPLKGRYRWLLHNWVVPDLIGFTNQFDDLLASREPSATLLRLQLAGIVPLTDRVAMLARIEDDIAHRLRHLDVRDADVVARPTEEDLAALSTEGMLGRAGAMLRAKIEADGPEAPRARRALERLFVEALRDQHGHDQEDAA